MKRTQQRVLLAGLLAFSLAACSYMPWRNTSGTTPATQPSSAAPSTAAPAGASVPSTDSGSSGVRSAASASSEPGSQN